MKLRKLYVACAVLLLLVAAGLLSIKVADRSKRAAAGGDLERKSLQNRIDALPKPAVEAAAEAGLVLSSYSRFLLGLNQLAVLERG